MIRWNIANSVADDCDLSPTVKLNTHQQDSRQDFIQSSLHILWLLFVFSEVLVIEWSLHKSHINDCSITITNALEILQFCTKESIWGQDRGVHCEFKVRNLSVPPLWLWCYFQWYVHHIWLCWNESSTASVYRLCLWLHSLYGLYGPHCPLSPERLLNLITHSLHQSPPLLQWPLLHQCAASVSSAASVTQLLGYCLWNGEARPLSYIQTIDRGSEEVATLVAWTRFFLLAPLYLFILLCPVVITNKAPWDCIGHCDERN